MKFIVSVFFLFFGLTVLAQDCPQATGLYTDNYTFNSFQASVEGHWDSMLGTGVADFLIKYKEVDAGEDDWNNLSNLDSTSTSRIIGPLNYNTTYVWSVVAYCSEGSFQDPAEWAVIDTFTTLAYEECPSPTNLNVDDFLILEDNAFAQGTWDSMSGTGVDHFILNYKLLSDTVWLSLSNMDSTVTSVYMPELVQNSFYEWRVQAYCSVNQSYFSQWSEPDTFYVEGFEPVGFSPSLEISISSLYCDSLVDLSITVEQDANEPDLQSSIFLSNSGQFDIENMLVDQKIGSAIAITGLDGFINLEYDLIVYEIINNNKATVGLLNLQTNLYDSLFDIENLVTGGVLINVVSPSDNNFYTSGNSLDLLFDGVFKNPQPTELEFYVDISSELSDEFSFETSFTIECDVNSIVENSINNALYPNPASTKVFLDGLGTKTIRFVDVVGRSALSVQTTANSIDISSLKEGLYLVYINNRFSQRLLIW